MKRLGCKKPIFISVSALILAFAIFQIFSIYRSAKKMLANERARLNEQNRVAFEKKILTPHLTTHLQILQNTSETRALVYFRNSYFAATGGGLVQFDESGKTEKHFTVLDGLPESDLTALAVFQDRLLIGTRTKNLLVFDGEKFENYLWTDRKTDAVTSFLEIDGKLLIGTFNGGLIEFDGKVFTEIKADEKRISAIIYLFKNSGKLYVGTFDNGLWIFENSTWSHFTKTDGLPSNRVVGIAVKDKNLYVATDFGLAILEEKRFRTLATLPSLSSLILHENQILLTKADGEISKFDGALKEFSTNKNLQNAQLTATTEKLFLLSNQGVSEITGAKIKPFNQAEASLTDNFVSALTIDAGENLWVGTFRHGIDVFAADGKKLKHLESESIREINFLQSREDEISAATSAGLQTFKKDFSVESLSKKDGLPSDSVTHFSDEFVTTAKGLAFRQNDRIRLISAVNGLPNNSTYNSLKVGEKLYLGTLGGLAEIQANKVVRVWKDSNSNLKTNWVTALCRANERVFIGTYGGGIFELLPSGEIRSFEGETGKFAVNPNAIFSDEMRLYIGTLDGVKILNLQTQEWKTVKNILPAETVMSITGNAKNVYFGTTNGIAKVEKKYFEDERNGF
jgi:ligand-binding sensor domain-containing protein